MVARSPNLEEKNLLSLQQTFFLPYVFRPKNYLSEMSQTDLKIENIFRSAETQLGLLLGWGNILFCKGLGGGG